MEINYFKRTGKWMLSACLVASAPMIPGTMLASELQTCYVSVQMETTTLKELFDLIEKEFSYSFLIRNNDIDLTERVSVEMKNRSVEEILKNALKNQHADFIVNNNKIIVYKIASKQGKEIAAASAQVSQQKTMKVQGTVIDGMTNDPVIGANVVVKGTLNGTSTDFDGNFELEVPEGAVLEISYIGYLKSEVKAQSGKMTMKIKEDTQALDEVVVVGYGVQKKESLTGAMQIVNSEKLTDATTPAVENMLSGKAPGVYVNAGSGQPGNAGKIVIRGKSTVNGSTDPLWVIDGVIVGSSAYDLNPADIESMSILKDAASTAIYGSQGANGVIVVTTKKAKTGEATVNVSAKLGVTQLSTGNFEMMDGAELYDYFRSFGNQGSITGDWYTEDLRNRNFDWWDNASQLGFAQDYNISINGGTEKLKTYISVGVYDENGAVKGYDYTRYNARLKVDYKVNNWLTVKPQLSGSRKNIHDQQHSVGAMYSNLPWDSPYLEDGSMVGHAPIPSWVNTSSSNYMYDLQWNYTESEAYEVSGGFDFDIKFTDWLTFSSVNNYRYSTKATKDYVDPRSYSGLADGGSIKDATTAYNRLYTNQLLRFNKTFGDHSVNGIAAYEWNEYNGTTNGALAGGIPPEFTVSDIAAVPKEITGSKTGWAVQSYLLNVNYAYDNRYLAQVSFRRDGASNFGENAKYGNFFSISGGWNIHRESFFTLDYINNLKLRASYGSVGNRPSELYPQYALYSLTTSYNEHPSAIISQLKNKDLTWEKTYTTGVGLDISLFDRVNITFDYYNKNTSGLLYNVPLPAVVGVTGIWRNVGCVKNNGFEASANVDVIKNQDLQWSIEANIGLNRNKVTELYGDKQEIIVGDGSGIAGSAEKLLKPGLDVDTWYLAEWAGVDPETGQATWYKTDENGERVKTFTYAEAAKTPIAKDSYTPKFFGGFSTNLNYKNFDLSAVFGYSVGGKIYNYSRLEFDSDGAYTYTNQMKLHKGWNRWEKPGDIATHPQPLYQNRTNSNQASTRFLENGSYLRLRNLTLGYNLSIPQWHISNLRVFASGENLFVLSGFSGVDPEIPPTSSGKVTGVASTVYPQTRKYMFGLNVTF